MKKTNLAATIAGCVFCAVMMIGATGSLQPCYTGMEDQPVETTASIEGSCSGVTEDDEVVDAIKFALAVKEAEEQAVAEAEAQKEAEEAAAETEAQEEDEEAAAVAQAEKSASGQAAAKAAPAKAQSPAKAASSSSSSKDAKSTGTPKSAVSQKKTCTITVNGVAIDYVDSYGTSSAPNSDAGIWRGSDSTTDGSFGYFIGHDYTDFGAVADLGAGSSVAVTDGDGNSRTYEVVDSFVVPRGTLWSEVSDRVTGYGESIVMQTCVDDGYMIVVAE